MSRQRNSNPILMGLVVCSLFVPWGGIFGLIQTATAAILLFFMQPELFRRNSNNGKWAPPLVGLAFVLSLMTMAESPIIEAFHTLVGGWIFDLGFFRLSATLFALATWFARDNKVSLWINTMAFSALVMLQIVWLSPVIGPVNVPQFVVGHSSPVLVRKMWNDLPKAAPFDELRKLGLPGFPSGQAVSFDNLNEVKRGKDAKAVAAVIVAPVIGGLPLAIFFSTQMGQVVGCLVGAATKSGRIPRTPIVWAWIGFTLGWLVHICSLLSAVIGNVAAILASPLTIGLNNATSGRFLTLQFANLFRGYLSGLAIGFMLLAAWELAKRRLPAEGRYYKRHAEIGLALAALLFVGIFQLILGGGLAPPSIPGRLLFLVYQTTAGWIVFCTGLTRNIFQWTLGAASLTLTLLLFDAFGGGAAAFGALAIGSLLLFFFSEKSVLFPREWGRNYNRPHHGHDDEDEEEEEPKFESVKIFCNRLLPIALASVCIFSVQPALVLTARTTAVPPVSTIPMSTSVDNVIDRVLSAPSLQGGRLKETQDGKIILCADTTEMLRSIESAGQRTGEVCGNPVPAKQVKAGSIRGKSYW